MRITVLAVNDYLRDPRALVLTQQLTAAGHNVVVVRLGGTQESDPNIVSRHQPSGSHLLALLIRKFQTRIARDRRREKALVKAAVQTQPEIIHPTTGAASHVAYLASQETGSLVARDPRWPSMGSLDLIEAAPHHYAANELFVSTETSTGSTNLLTPTPGRHGGKRIALAYRKTDSNPGKYLEAAMRRAGIAVDLFTDTIDFDQLHKDTTGILFVEGPYPAFTVTGNTPTIPIAFWVHHGEHHLAANLRLAKRYQADLVLLAHSWHLSHFFRQPVHRFPFGMEPGLFDGSTPISQRKYDVAMVGAHIRGGGPYSFRGQLTTSLEESLDSTAFEEGVSLSRMVQIYEQARIIPNEGGTRHLPITMRVLEAVGAGALLVSQPVPGLSEILQPGEHFIEMETDFVSQFKELLGNLSRIQNIANAASDHVTKHHLYDHRVDALIAGFGTVQKATPGTPTQSFTQLEGLIDQDVDVQRILVAPGTALELEGRELWNDVEDPLPKSYQATVFRGAIPPQRFLMAARSYIYAETNYQSELNELVLNLHPQAGVYRSGRLVRFDLRSGGYRSASP